MKKLIQENNFDKFKEALRNSSSGLKIHNILLQILDNETVNENEFGFEANVYQEEFLEGFDLYKALAESAVSESQLEEYKSVLIFLVFKLGGFIKLMADTAMRKGVYLSQIENVYKVDPALRNTLQKFIDLLEGKNEVKAIANIAAAKAQISLSIGNLLNKPEIGKDMLQFAISYENVGMKDQAIQIYKNILKDFECESVKSSSGLFPEITHVDTRTTEEIQIFEAAKKGFDAISKENLPKINRVDINSNEQAKRLVEEVNNQETQINKDNEKLDKPIFWGKFRKLFT